MSEPCVGNSGSRAELIWPYGEVYSFFKQNYYLYSQQGGYDINKLDSFHSLLSFSSECFFKH